MKSVFLALVLIFSVISPLAVWSSSTRDSARKALHFLVVVSHPLAEGWSTYAKAQRGHLGKKPSKLTVARTVLAVMMAEKSWLSPYRGLALVSYALWYGKKDSSRAIVVKDFVKAHKAFTFFATLTVVDWLIPVVAGAYNLVYT